MLGQSLFREATRALVRTPIRSCLTMLGIIMGVASFICVVGIGQAGSAQVSEQLLALGDNMIWIAAGSRLQNGVRLGNRQTTSLTMEDAQAILAQVPLI